MSNTVVGVDIGGSHINCALYDIVEKAFASTKRFRRTVNSQDAGDKILDSWAEAIGQAIEEAAEKGFAGIGFAMPGPFDYLNGISLIKGVHKFEDLYGVNIGEEIRKRLALVDDLPVRFLNDAACFAIGESFREPAIQHERLLAITLGTGFGTTFIDKHLPVAGQDGVPADGFLYHIPYGESMADDYFSTRWFQKEYLEREGKKLTGVKELFELAKTDAVALDIFKTFGKNLGAFLASWLRNYNAEGLVIGGNISAAHSLFLNELKQEFQKDSLNVSVYVSHQQEDASLIGSASLCDNTLYSRLISKNL